jgi:N-hydroxyarylamine O-acetyltransferase
MFDLEAYLRRISLTGETDLASVHRGHVTSIPFENLDPLRGLPVELDLESLQQKLVERGRGGYCFEHNLLLKAALEDLGATVEPMLARVRWGRPPGTSMPLTHLLLRVTLEGEVWHADVGFGNGTLLEPIPFGVGGPYEQSGWQFRVIEEADELVLQTLTDDGWGDVYSFLPRPVQQIDIELSNWYTSTHPDSAFVNRLLLAKVSLDGTRTMINDFSGELTLSVRTPDGVTKSVVERSELPQILLREFELSAAGVVAAT